MQPTADGKGKRYDDGKTRFELIPFDALRVIAEVFTQGAAKYEPRNWERGMLFSRCLGSLMRHITAWQNGEDVDAESGLPHMAHAAWNCIALLTYGLRGTGEDDRPKSAGKDLGDRIQSLLKEQFDAPAVVDDSKGSVNAAVAEENKRAAGITYKAVEICDDGIFERNAKGERVHYTGPLFEELHKMFVRRPGISPSSPFWQNRACGVVEIKPGSKIRIHDKEGIWRVLADLGVGKFSTSKIIGVKALGGTEVRGPIEVVHLSKIAEVL